MTDQVRRQAVLLPAPRHLRKRRFRSEISPSLMGGYTTDASANPLSPASPALAKALITDQATASAKMSGGLRLESGDITHRQKRLIALVLVILVTISVPVLALTLIFAR